MMEEFTASNGISIREGEWGYYEYMVKNGTVYSEAGRYAAGSPLDLAMGEYYRAKEDERLGRWRYNRNIVVYAGSGSVRVLDEQGGHVTNEFHRAHFTKPEGELSNVFRHAARAYFDAHPEPKPWHDAKPGEVWVITFSEPGGGTTDPWTMNRNGLFENPNYVSCIRVKDSTIISARKIWPTDD